MRSAVETEITARGAFLSDLIADLSGVTVSGNMIVQYADAGGIYADCGIPTGTSAYKDKVGWLTDPHEAGSQVLQQVRTMIAYEVSAGGPEVDFHSPNNTGYLAAYRETGGDEGSGVLNNLMGVVISPDGDRLTGRDGYTLELIATGTGGQTTRDETVVSGLVPGMAHTVKAPRIAGLGPDPGLPLYHTITIGSGTTETVSFKYIEDPDKKEIRFSA